MTRMFKLVSGLLFLLVFPFTCRTYADLPLVVEGKSNYEILLSPSALPITCRSAQDLQLYIKKATGVDLPLRMGEALSDHPAVLIGDHPVSRSQGVSPDDLKQEGFHLRTLGKNLIIVGKDTAGDANSYHWRNAPQAGTWHGVSAFLEKELGIRWFFPGEDGEYVPALKSISISSLDVTDAPKMIYRPIGYLYESETPPARTREVIDWLRRNRSGWSLIWSASHVWGEYFKGDTYYKNHPDWFALVGGRRLSSRPLGIQMCTTNPQALDEFARVIIEEGQKNPGVMFSLSPNDGGDFCECPSCTALDVRHFPDGTPVLSDRIMTYANEVAKRVTRVLPNQTFGIYAYSYFTQPPVHVKLHPNVYVMEVENNIAQLYYSEAFRKYHLEKILIPWKAQQNNLLFYTHPEGFGNIDLPSMQKTVIKELFKNLHRVGIKGLSLNYGESFASTALDRYLYLKMAWNPGADFDSIYADALLKCYGKDAAPLVDAYFNCVEKRALNFCGQIIKKQDVAMGTAPIFPGALETMYRGLYDEGRPLLEKALSLSKDTKQQSRIRLLLDNLDYTQLTVDLYRKAKKVLTDASPQADEILQAKNLTLTREDQLKKQNHTNQHQSNGVTYVQQAFSLPFNAAVFDQMLLEARGGKRKANCKLVSIPPVIDGDLSDVAWKDLEELPVDLNKDTGVRSPVTTVARVCRDEKNLYVSVHCPESDMLKIKDSIVKRDGEVWNENEIEFFFDVDHTQKRFHHLLVNSLGTLADFVHEKDQISDWDSKALVAVRKGADYWDLEAAIPLTAFTETLPLPGDLWGFNLCRVRTTVEPSEYTCWSPTFGGFLQPKRFGFLVMN